MSGSTDQVRLVQIVEYTFPDVATMERHTSLMDIPLNGQTVMGDVLVRSASLFPTGAHASLFTVVAPEAPTSIIILAESLRSGLLWAERHHVPPGFVVISSLAQAADRLLGTDRTPGVPVVQLDSFTAHPSWGGIRSQVYAAGLEISSESEWATHINERN